jgi:hypothetical protein
MVGDEYTTITGKIMPRFVHIRLERQLPYTVLNLLLYIILSAFTLGFFDF